MWVNRQSIFPLGLDLNRNTYNENLFFRSDHHIHDSIVNRINIIHDKYIPVWEHFTHPFNQQTQITLLYDLKGWDPETGNPTREKLDDLSLDWISESIAWSHSMRSGNIYMRLYLGGYLDFYNSQPGNWLEVDLNQSSQLKEILVELEIPVSDVYLVVVNGQ